MTPTVRVTVNGQPFRDVTVSRAEAQAYCPDGETLRDDWSPDNLSIVHMLRAQFVARIWLNARS